MATTTITGKKKLVYKQDSDGVFRLKRADSDNDSIKSKKGVDDYLNELVECSYKVQHDVEHNTAEEEPTTSFSKPIVDDQTQRDNSSRPKNSKIPNRESRQKHQQSDDLSFKTKILTLGGITDALNFKTEHMQGFSLPSFIFGFALAFVAQTFQPLLIHYAFILMNILKAGLLCGAIIGSILWYSGFLKPEDLKNFISELRERVSGTISSEQEQDDVLEQVPNVHEEIHNLERQRFSRRERSVSPSKGKRNVLTRVAPFRPLVVRSEQKYKSTSDLPGDNRMHMAPKLSRVQTDFRNYTRRGSSFLSDRRHSNSSGDSVGNSSSLNLLESVNKKLPPNPSELEELPFINEIKLMNSDDMDTLDELPRFSNDLKRNTSIMSKKSVLGTRANYSKFLANASGED
ncbi:uncharacterized protein PRCAT00003076001 [Priceomyces carsonii]|uniref:uncharacterized protein n=1 Tax=Priceomyces carsonii TaxID=28549 RepID=UPI002EDAE4D0|nr:unnamed protein product [Priceomyces carsonii]